MQSLKFNVAQLLKQTTGAIRSYTLAEDISPLTDGVIFAPLRGSIRFTRTEDGVLVTGHLQTAVDLPCRRCAAIFTEAIALDLEEEFNAAFDVYTGLRLPPRDTDEAETMIDEQHMLDLSEVIRQNVLLAVPPFPLCRPECKGLCPHCGQDLNAGPCDCKEEEIDARWSALQAFLGRSAS